MAGVRFEDVDLLGALSRIVDLHTQHYKDDFDLDKELISKLAVSDRSEDKQLLWMSRPCGTYTLREREVYLDGSHENKVWRFYQEQTNDPVLAYAISLKEVRDGKIFGDLYPLNYREYVERMKQLTCPIGNVVYDYLKQELITRGVPEEEICFIHDAKTDEQRDRMFSDVRAGRKRIIIGSTEKLGVGTNIQTRMVAAHHIDCPWKPSDIEQREGRIIRQGNENEEVNIYRYVTKGSFDAYLWGIVETKQRFISQVFTSRELARICEDIDETVLNFAEIKEAASENPLIMEKIQVDNEVARLRILKAAHEGKRFTLQDAVTFQYPKRIQSLKGELQLLQKDLERRNQAMEVQPGFAITLQGKVYEKHKEAGEVLRGIIEGVTAFTRHEVGIYKGFQVSVQNDMLGPILFLQGEKEYSVELKSSDSGNMVRIENRLNALDKAVEDVQKEIQTCENEMKNAKQEYEKPFPYEELLKENITRQMEIDAELEIKDQEECVEVQEETRNLPCQTAVR